MKDYLVRGMTMDSFVKVVAIRSTELVSRAAQIHGTTPCVKNFSPHHSTIPGEKEGFSEREARQRLTGPGKDEKLSAAKGRASLRENVFWAGERKRTICISLAVWVF